MLGDRSQANLQGKQPRWSKRQVQASQGDHLSPVMGRRLGHESQREKSRGGTRSCGVVVYRGPPRLLFHEGETVQL